MPLASTGVRAILLDIEGTTSSISFVHEVMFPFVLQRLESFLEQHLQRSDVQQACQQIAADAGQASLAAWQQQTGLPSLKAVIVAEVQRLMAADVKATGLKALQGLIWEEGFAIGELVAHVYPDVLPAIRQWCSLGIDVRIYSSGSIAAQKLFFGHVAEAGNCLDLFTGHYDTTSGSKKEPDSYRAIADDWGLPEGDILFISDLAAELSAARSAGLQVCASVRPGNAELPPDLNVRCIHSFDQALSP